ncbi:lamin tail domain-containing protein [Sphingobacterium bovistauri]|uniref:Lamin tail domain-containing protein n=1 Tax=Sphingobacterium bovistauri TaxID=2781959 RepID=A0ABS7Z209_9SPHI|nr:lamin tail domain-containing protein [Sphingobacterium bovistauri]MCA5004219.1 lamin tail domain-containing protein [Sphingobacterium bovistauri]
MKLLVKLYLLSLILAFNIQIKALAQSAPSLIINELMINPNNTASLPPFEYIEIFNNSTATIDLSEIILHINNNSQILPNYKIAPNQYILLCSQESLGQFSRYGNAVSLIRWSPLNNTSATIKLTQKDVLIDEVAYTDSWYNNTSKRNGGWSLERINPNWTCNINLNWSATNSLTGGSPGKPNTILNENFTPNIGITAYQIQRDQVYLTIDLNNSYFPDINTSSFTIIENVGKATKVEFWENKIVLTFPTQLDAQKLYTLKIENLRVCNLTIPPFDLNLFDQKEIKSGDILVNEILFNPKEGGVDFVELYNHTGFPINLQHFKLGNRSISSQFFLFEPGQYLAITTNKSSIIKHYPNAYADRILEIASLPPYTNQRGNVTLYSDQNLLLDSVYYTAEMHSKHLIDSKGISLERTSFDNLNWHSASTLIGGATPGYQNSTQQLSISQNKTYLNSKTFSPNNDGYEDELTINYELINPNYIIAVEIYNDKGQLVKKLAHQNLSGTNGSVTWDGVHDNGSPCPRGHYICFTQIFNHEGKTQKFKQPFVLINSLARH